MLFLKMIPNAFRTYLKHDLKLTRWIQGKKKQQYSNVVTTVTSLLLLYQHTYLWAFSVKNPRAHWSVCLSRSFIHCHHFDFGRENHEQFKLLWLSKIGIFVVFACSQWIFRKKFSLFLASCPDTFDCEQMNTSSYSIFGTAWSNVCVCLMCGYNRKKQSVHLINSLGYDANASQNNFL